ncbi:MAG: right-handed parallel beta-helix repeat-containing protein [Verrucomicrobiales bacterium]|nr:right-handed parallel beta-helix repeat-containing protein [Verrucomicrobiales bacterium]
MRSIYLALNILLIPFSQAISADLPTASSQFEDLRSLPDRTREVEELRDAQNGNLVIPTGVYRITSTIELNLKQEKSAIVRPESGPVTLIMDGPGPAIHIKGSHEGSASPKSFQPATWHERTPLVDGIEIVGNHPEAIGIALEQCMQPTLSRVSVRWCKHGIHLVNRNRNVAISDVHLYENSGIGLFLDDINLHQINVSNSHISYNRGGGIVVRDGNVRNLQITGCDIEANMPGDDSPTETANILLDVAGSDGDRSRSIAEVAITGCTIQHSSNYGGAEFDQLAPGGANIRILGKEIWPIDSVTITGNVMSDTSLGVDIHTATDITLTGNNFFAPNPDFLHITDSKRVIVNGNTFNPRQFERPGGIRLSNCDDCILSNNTFRALKADAGAILIKDSRGISLNDNILSESRSGVRVQNSHRVMIKDWIVSGLPDGISHIFQDDASTVETGN